MSLEVIKFGFTAGELSPAFYGRPDLEKFDFGLARAYNWFVDFRGGLSSRPGFLFNEFLKEDDKPIMMFEFRFNTDLGNTYNMIFGHNYIRFVQDGAYITETAKTPSAITKANPGVVTSNAHGYNNGDWLKLDGIGGMTELNGRTVAVANKTANTFQLTDHTGANINTSAFTVFTAGGNLRRVYEIVTTYDSTDVDKLCISQYRDRVTITHSDYAQAELVRNDATDWDFTAISFVNPVTSPTGLADTKSGSFGTTTVYAVTAVNTDGEESLSSTPYILANGENFDNSIDYHKITWTIVPAADYYNVYRSLLKGDAAASRTEQLGYIGRAFGAVFPDNGIIPDFTKTPSVGNNPFASAAITHVNITADGSGYTNASTFTVTDAGGGTGFIGFPIVDNGNLVGVKIINGGSGYVTPVASISVGAGATVTFDISPATGMWPGLNAVHQQRQVYAASTNSPLTLWGSRPGFFDNFDVSDIVAENDSYEFELDSGDLTPIKHLMVVRGGLLCLTETGIWVVNGGNESAAITPTNVLADPHTFVGCADVRPIRIDTDLIYVEHKGYTVRELAYNDFSKLYSGTDISILSNHFFSKSQEITSWTYASDPHKLIWAVKTDGKMLTLTIVKDQKVYAWCEHGTKGFVERVLTLEEDGRDIVYFIVQRYVNGRWTKSLESLSSRLIAHVENAVVMDSALTLPTTEPAAILNFSAATGACTFTAASAVFSVGDVGKVLRAHGGKAEITGYTSATVITGTWIRDPTHFIPETEDLGPSASGDWTLDDPVSTVSGLHHLEGQTVQVLVDGNRQTDKVVSAGSISLDIAGTRVCVGLAYQSTAQSLPLTLMGDVIEGRRKRIPALVLRQLESRGLRVGQSLDSLYYMKERTNEPIGEPTRLQSGEVALDIQPDWESGGQLYFVRTDPTPVSLLGYVTSADIGDDPN